MTQRLHTAYLTWQPQPDISEVEQALARPILPKMKRVEFVLVPPALSRHFKYGPLVGWKDSMNPEKQR
jgi:hypothetical protein